MKYYIINDKAIGDEAHVSQFDTADLVCAFIKEKLESFGNYHVSDFQVIGGQPLGIKVLTEKKVYLTN